MDAEIAVLEEALPSLMRAAQIPGLSIALIRDGAVTWMGGFGVKRAGSSQPVTPAIVFEGASFSKPLFAYGALRLVPDGLIDLDTPLTAHLPDRSFCDDPRLAEITARMVLCHTTGLPNWRRRGKPLTVDRTPGDTFGYSGEGYIYLQRAVERITGRPLHEYMQQRVLTPLEMAESSYVWRASYQRDAATGHKCDGTPRRKDRPKQARAAASLHTTPRDFARFLTHVLDARGHPPATDGVDVDAMLTPQVRVAGDLWWTLGWGLQREPDDQIIWHWGDNPGFTSFAAARLAQRSGVVVMANSDSGLRIWQEIARIVLGLNTEIFDWLAQAFYGCQDFAQARLRQP